MQESSQRDRLLPCSDQKAGLSSMQTLKDKVAVITGAGSGIGRSMALALAEVGTHIVVADIQEASAASVAEEVKSRDVRSIAVACDVSDVGSVTQLADRAYGEFRSVDILCNNAGVSMRPYRNIMDTTVEDWRFLLGINLWGVLYGLIAFLPRMRQQLGEKHIVNTASLAGMLPMEGHSVYSASKGAVMNLTEAIAGELTAHGFGVTNFCPGPVPTNLGENVRKIWGDAAGASTRPLDLVETPTMTRVNAAPMPTLESVGVMVRNAILDNSLYLHTAAIASDLVADQVHKMYGGQTIGRTD
jgi:NAD(P)-dependent dehydrogenase (short-subunit alcohol dehydrogenase family)